MLIEPGFVGGEVGNLERLLINEPWSREYIAKGPRYASPTRAPRVHPRLLAPTVTVLAHHSSERTMVDGTQFVPGLDYGNGWTSTIWSILTSVTGLSVSSTSLSGSQTGSSDGTIWSWKILPVLLVGSLVEIGRRLCLWTLQRFKFRRSLGYQTALVPRLLTRIAFHSEYYITAEFHEGDPTYDWIILLLVCP